jgi:HlyD family secretion protein
MSMDRAIKKKRFPPRVIAVFTAGILFTILIIYELISTSGVNTLRIDKEKIIVSEVVYGEFQEFIPITGEVTPVKTIYLDAVQGGAVLEVFLEEGAYVNTGDKILQLDNTDLQLDIMYREAQLFEQINNLRNTRLAIEQNSLNLRAELLDINRQIRNSNRRYQQSKALKLKNLISEYEYQDVNDEYEYWQSKKSLTLETQKQDSLLRTIQINQLEQSVNRMQHNLEVVKKKLDKLILRAPIDGHLTSLDADIGELILQGTRLGKIDILEGFKLRANVDEYYINRITKDLKGDVKIAGVTYSLNIIKVYPEVKEGRFEIDMEFDVQPPNIRRGQSVQVRLALGELTEAIMLPRGGFYQETGGSYIFVIDKSGDYAIRRNINLGRYNTQVYEVLDSLIAGEKVITSSYANYKQFDKLVLKHK